MDATVDAEGVLVSEGEDLFGGVVRVFREGEGRDDDDDEDEGDGGDDGGGAAEGNDVDRVDDGAEVEGGIWLRTFKTAADEDFTSDNASWREACRSNIPSRLLYKALRDEYHSRSLSPTIREHTHSYS